MKLTVGMAHIEDFESCRTTILGVMSLNIWQRDELEIVVVDNSPPSSLHARELAAFCSNFQAKSCPIRVVYIRDEGPPSSYRSRNRIFEEATGEWVLVIDCHVDMAPRQLNRFLSWTEDNADCPHLLTGVLIRDAGAMFMQFPEMPKGFFYTHYTDRMRSEMWGTWGEDDRGAHLESQPFEISGMGLGLFACRRDKWLGFHPAFRGFGGGEKYLHEKYLKAGFTTFCLPFMRWLHRFQYVGLRPYSTARYPRVRNSVIAAQSLERSVDVIYEHWVDRGKHMTDEELRAHLISDHRKGLTDLDKMDRQMLNRLHEDFKISEDDWKYLLDDPIGHTIEWSPKSFQFGRNQPPPSAAMVTADYVKWLTANGSPAYKGMLPEIAAWGAKVDRVTEFASRRESTVGFIGSGCKELLTHTTDTDQLLKKVRESTLRKKEIDVKYRLGVTSQDIDSIPPTDLLFLDSQPHQPGRIARELSAFAPAVSRFIMIRGLQSFGEYEEGHHKDPTFPGLIGPVREFMKSNPQWFVTWADPEIDLALLGRLPEDKPAVVQHAWDPKFGPGSNMKRILNSVAIYPTAHCACNHFASLMNVWGYDGCKRRYDRIVEHLRKEAPKWGWTGFGSLFKKARDENELSLVQKWMLPLRAMRAGLVGKIDPRDPFPGLANLCLIAPEGEMTVPEGVTGLDVVVMEASEHGQN